MQFAKHIAAIRRTGAKRSVFFFFSFTYLYLKLEGKNFHPPTCSKKKSYLSNRLISLQFCPFKKKKKIMLRTQRETIALLRLLLQSSASRVQLESKMRQLRSKVLGDLMNYMKKGGAKEGRQPNK